jgi:hypothetical protein
MSARRTRLAALLLTGAAAVSCGPPTPVPAGAPTRAGTPSALGTPAHRPPPAVAVPPAPPLGPSWRDAPPSPRPATPPAAPPAGGCPLFPADNVWHARADRLPVLAGSGTYVDSIGASAHLHPDFGAGFGIPVTEVPPGTRGVRVGFDYAEDSDDVPYPIPAHPRIEAGGDGHIILHDAAACRLYELFDASGSGSSWHAGSGASWSLRSNALRPRGFTSADAAGLPIMAGLVRYDEVAAGRVDHAIRLTVPRSADTFLWPARHAAGSGGGVVPMGLRLRLKASVDIAGMPPAARAVAQALKTYGAIVADNGSAWYITGTDDARWDDDALGALKSIPGSSFEAVDESGLMADPNSAAVR